MDLLFDGPLRPEGSACISVVRFSAAALVTQVRVTQAHYDAASPLELLVHSMPSSSKPFAHLNPLCLTPDRTLPSTITQVFDLHVSPDATMPALMAVFRGAAWTGAHVQLLGYVQKKRPAAHDSPTAATQSEPKRVKRQSSPQPDSLPPPTRPDFDAIQSLLCDHRSQRHDQRKTAPESTISIDQIQAAKDAWRPYPLETGGELPEASSVEGITDFSECLSALSEDPSRWSLALQHNVFDDLQDQEPGVQAAFWGLVLQSDLALSHAVHHLLSNAPDRLTSPLPGEQLSDFLYCAAMQAGHSALDEEALAQLQQGLLSAAVALALKGKDEALFWSSFRDETLAMLMHRLNAVVFRYHLPGLDPWRTDSSPEAALKKLAASRQRTDLTAQTTSSVLNSLQTSDVGDLERSWAAIHPFGPPLFFAVLSLTERWLCQLERASCTGSVKDKDALCLGLQLYDGGSLRDLVWIQLLATATLDRLSTARSTATPHFLLLSYRQVMSTYSVKVSGANLLHVVALGVLVSLSAQLEVQDVVPVLRKLLRIISERCSPDSMQALQLFLRHLPQASLSGRKLLTLVPELATFLCDALHQDSIDAIVFELEDLSAASGNSLMPALASEVQRHAVDQSSAVASNIEALGLFAPLTVLKRLDGLDHLPSQVCERLREWPALHSFFPTRTTNEALQEKSGIDWDTSELVQLVMRPRRDSAAHQAFVIKRYEGPEGFRDRTQSQNSSNVRPASMHVDTYMQ